MVNSYSRYEPSELFGVIASPECNVTYDFTGNLAITGTLQNISVWNLRQATQVATLKTDQHNYPYTLTGKVVYLCLCPDKVSVAAGFTNGDVRIFNYISKSIVATLKSHRTSVLSLCYDASGSMLASGGADSDILIWDMITTTAVCKLRDHKDGVTGVTFFQRNSQQLLLSVSKDTLLKVWDLNTQYCIQTIVGHRCEIWSIGFCPSRNIIVTGCADELIRGYRLVAAAAGDEISSSDDAPLLSDDAKVIEYFGCIKRSVDNNSDRCSGLHFNTSNTMLAIQSSSKLIEVYRIRTDTEMRKKTKRRQKRLREKDNKNASNNNDSNNSNKMDNKYSSWNEEEDNNANNANNDSSSSSSGNNVFTFSRESMSDSIHSTLGDQLELFCTIRCTAKIRGCSFNPNTSKDGIEKVLVSLINNVLETYQIPRYDEAIHIDSTVIAAEKASILELQGHRSDVRCIALSTDNKQIATCAGEYIKVWSSQSLSCLRSCKSGVGLCIAFVPSSRYVVIGTKEGKIQVADTAACELVIDSDAHNGAIHCLDVRPDGKGFMTGSEDKEVKFWDFYIEDGKIGAKLVRELKMTSDVLTVKYSPTKTQDKLLISIGLLDNTVKLFYDDSLKFFLSLYGHKLPILCCDISHDSKLLVTGSADKTIKLWGLDFGDCHRSFIGHEDSVTCLRFQPDTHYFFSGGKDGIIKYWDGDKFEQILILPGHFAAVWSIDISSDGNFIASGGADRSLRIWERSDDLVFIEEEKEKALEAIADRAAEDEGPGGKKSDSIDGVVTIKTIESVKGGEMLMDAMDLVEAEISELNNDNTRVQQGRKVTRTANPLLLGLTPYKYMVSRLKLIKAPDLEQALVIMPFHYVCRLVRMLLMLAQRGLDIELCTRCAIFLLRCHQSQVVTTQSLLNEMIQLQSIISTSISTYRSIIGTNLSGLRFMQTMIRERKMGTLFGDVIDTADMTTIVTSKHAKDKKKENKKKDSNFKKQKK